MLWVPKAGPGERIPRVGCSPLAFDGALQIVFQDGLPDALGDEVQRRVAPKFRAQLRHCLLNQETMRAVVAMVQQVLFDLVAEGRLRRRTLDSDDWVFDDMARRIKPTSVDEETLERDRQKIDELGMNTPNYGEPLSEKYRQLAKTPQFAHDLKCCVFLGRYMAEDLYFCEQHGLPTVIARFGNAGPAYRSGLALASVDSALAEAKDRAEELGLIKVSRK